MIQERAVGDVTDGKFVDGDVIEIIAVFEATDCITAGDVIGNDVGAWGGCDWSLRNGEGLLKLLTANDGWRSTEGSVTEGVMLPGVVPGS